MYLDHYTSRLDDVFVPYKLSEDLKKVSGEVHFEVAALSREVCEDLELRLTLHAPGGENLVLEKHVGISHEQWNENEKSFEGDVAFELDSPQLWYPHMYGKPNQYRLKVELLSREQVMDAQTKLVPTQTFDQRSHLTKTNADT